MEWRRLEDDIGAQAHIVAWAVFALTLGTLLAVDVAFLQAPLSAGRMSFQTAAKLTMFWMVTGLMFNVWIWGYLGFGASVGFLQGMLLEYMLSFDNLFVFNLIFSYYCTPEALLYRALYFGIAGAIVLRIVFLSVGWNLMNSGVYLVKLCFGVLLVWSGVKAASDSEESDQDPTKNRCVRWLMQNLPVTDEYEPHGHFFVTVLDEDSELGNVDELASWVDQERELAAAERCRSEDSGFDSRTALVGLDGAAGGLPRLESFEGSSLLGPGSDTAPMPGLPRLESFEGSSLLEPARADAARPPVVGMDRRLRSASLSGLSRAKHTSRGKTKATLLLLVVVAVWAVDLLFAVDSVASKLASVSDVFLNCSSSAFAMLSLRSLYFIVDTLSKTFKLLKYGIAAVLVLIGMKLILSGVIEIPMAVTFFLILGIVVGSIASSSYFPALQDACERVERGMDDEADDEGSLTALAFNRAALPLTAADEEGSHVTE